MPLGEGVIRVDLCHQRIAPGRQGTGNQESQPQAAGAGRLDLDPHGDRLKGDVGTAGRTGGPGGKGDLQGPAAGMFPPLLTVTPANALLPGLTEAGLSLLAANRV